MAKYSTYFFCDECSQVHPLGINRTLDDGPSAKASIGDTYSGKELPPQVAQLMGNMTKCPSTGKLTSQKDNDQVFLVPIGLLAFTYRLSLFILMVICKGKIPIYR
jgi:hypothetical protein